MSTKRYSGWAYFVYVEGEAKPIEFKTETKAIDYALTTFEKTGKTCRVEGRYYYNGPKPNVKELLRRAYIRRMA